MHVAREQCQIAGHSCTCLAPWFVQRVLSLATASLKPCQFQAPDLHRLLLSWRPLLVDMLASVSYMKPYFVASSTIYTGCVMLQSQHAAMTMRMTVAPSIAAQSRSRPDLNMGSLLWSRWTQTPSPQIRTSCSARMSLSAARPTRTTCSTACLARRGCTGRMSPPCCWTPPFCRLCWTSSCSIPGQSSPSCPASPPTSWTPSRCCSSERFTCSRPVHWLLGSLAPHSSSESLLLVPCLILSSRAAAALWAPHLVQRPMMPMVLIAALQLSLPLSHTSKLKAPLRPLLPAL